MDKMDLRKNGTIKKQIKSKNNIIKASVLLLVTAIIIVNVDSACCSSILPAAYTNTGVGIYEENADLTSLLNPFSLFNSLKEFVSDGNEGSLKFLIKDVSVKRESESKFVLSFECTEDFSELLGNKESTITSDMKVCILGSGVDLEQVSFAYGYDFIESDLTPEGKETDIALEIQKQLPGAELVIAKADGSDENMVLEALDWCIRQKPDVIYMDFEFEEGSLISTMINKATLSGISIIPSSQIQDLSDMSSEIQL